MQEHEKLLACLREPTSAIAYALSGLAKRSWPADAILETEDPLFEPHRHAHASGMSLRVGDDIHPQWDYSWDHSGGAARAPRIAVVEGEWEGHAIRILSVSYTQGFREARRHYLCASSLEVARAYFVAVCEHNAEVVDEVLVFANGCWNRSAELFQSVRSAAFDDLVLAPGLADTVRGDFKRFLGSRDAYAKWGVPWKRGALFLGPPGNGKTLCIRALVRELGLPCLYIQSFAARGVPDEVSIRAVFERARRQAPCVMVLEDLDALVTPTSRSFFLNELDGFASNAGLVTIASTNHPERLDPAIVDRPSRFDRKYHFGLPDHSERLAYLQLWNRRLPDTTRLDDASARSVADATEEFSFAYLKELVASALMRAASDAVEGREHPLAQLLVDEARVLRDQMKTHEIVPEARVASDIESPWAHEMRGTLRGRR